MINVAYTMPCCHQFCFPCIEQWTRIRLQCPLCKRGVQSIIHTVQNCFCPLKLKDSHPLSFHCALQLCCSSLQGTSVRCLQYLCIQEAE
uniref:RING-type E3 ubiquitin transferase n=1 Tax=Meleagris gallopavo TaxID=9103 RepID=A0A803YFP0_MELGA